MSYVAVTGVAYTVLVSSTESVKLFLLKNQQLPYNQVL